MQPGILQRNTGAAQPWVLDTGEETELVIDILEADGEAARQTLGEPNTYIVTFREPASRYGPPTVNERYHTLLKRGRYADSFELQPTLNGTPTFTITGGADEDVIVSLEHLHPDVGSSVPGLWGLIEAVDPEDPPASPSFHTSGPNWAQISLSIVYLGHIDEYDDREDLQDALENPGLI